jgi:YidC/Oxa1 family membrane protein insertase
MVFLWALKGLYGWLGNYGLAIIVLTIIVKLLFFPLTHKSYISMAKMQKIQPEVQKIQKKYKDNPQEMNKRVMEVYQKNKVNPMGGCLPLLLQFPVLWALFRVFSNAIELKGEPFMLWIRDLSIPDTLFKLPFGLPFLGENFNVLPILMFASMIWMQKLTPAQGNVQGANKFMMQVFMPVFMLIIFYSMPSGLVLYFLLSNAISIGQQQYTRKHLKAQEG